MAQQIKLKRSAVAGRVPTTSSLALGEIAVNTEDGKLFFQRGDSTIQSFFTTNALITGSLQQSGSDSYFLSNLGIGTTTPTYNLEVVGGADVVNIAGSGSTANTSIFAIDGNNGRLFEVSDDLSDSLFSVNTIAGLPVVEVFSDNRVIMGAFNQNDFVISGSKVGIGTATPTEKLTVQGNISASGDLYLDGAIFDTNDTSGSLGQVLTSVAGGTTWEDVGTAVLDEVENIYARVKNASGGILYKGTPVHAVSGSSSGQVNPVIAASASDASTMPATFILNEDLADEAEGQAIIAGHITQVDTSAFNVGDVVYVGESGGYTNVKPTGSANLIQNLGVVTKVHASNGSGVIYGSGRSNDVPNLPVGKIWVGSDTYSVTSSLVHLDEDNGVMELTGSLAVEGGGLFDPTGGQQVILKRYADNVNANEFVTAKARGTKAAPTAVQNGDYLGGMEFHGYDGSAYVRSSFILPIVTGSIASGDVRSDIRFSTRQGSGGAFSYPMVITSDKKVGINTLSPTEALDVTGNVRAGNTGRVHLADDEISVNIYTALRRDSLRVGLAGTDFTLGTRQSGGTYNTDQLVLKSTGDVGIGTTTPAYKLDVSGSGNFTNGLTVTGSLTVSGSSTFTNIGPAVFSGSVDTNNNITVNRTDNTAAVFTLNTDRSFGREFTITNNGQIPQINARDQLLISADGNDAQILLDASGQDYIKFVTAATEQARIVQSGNLGIGTTAPSQKLTVAGNISASGDLITESDLLIGYNTNLGRKVTIADTGTEQEGIHIRTGQPTIDLQDWNTGGKGVITSNDGSITLQADVNANKASSNISFEVDTVQRLRVDENGVQITGSLTHDGDLTVTGTVTAQEFKTEFVSASIIYRSGSTKFGDTLDDQHSFTGSVEISGSALTLTGASADFNIQNNAGGNVARVATTTGGNARVQLYDYVTNGSALEDFKAASYEHDALLIKSGSSGDTKFLISRNPASNVMQVYGNSYISGSLGIGTATPSHKLHVSNGSDTLLVTRDVGTAVRIGIGTANPSAAIDLGAYSGNDIVGIKYLRFYDSNDRITANGNGRIALNASRGYFFYPTGSTPSYDNYGVEFRHLRDSATNTNDNILLVEQSDGTDVLNVKSSGNVGIGTTNPSERLHITGSVKIEGGTLLLNNGDNSVYIGDDTGLNDDKTNNYNVGVGPGALADVTSGTGNIAIGRNALADVTTGDGNVAVGPYAASSLTTYTGTTAIGASSQQFGITGQRNTSLGYRSLHFNETGDDNVVIGHSAQYSASVDDVVMIGYAAGEENVGSHSVGIGYQALRNNTALYTVGIGKEAARNNTGTGQSVFVGWRTGINNTGNNSTAVGTQALYNNSGASVSVLGRLNAYNNTGDFLDGVGFSVGFYNSGDHVIGMGYRAVYNNEGTGVVGIGREALSNNSGSYNTALGYLAGYESDTALNNVKNTFLGYKASYGTSGSIVNSTAVGAEVTLTDSNTVILGNNASVGIGTTTPAEKLTVEGNISGSGDLTLGSGDIYTPANTLDFFHPGNSAKAVRMKSLQVSTAYNGTIPDNGILFGTDTTLYRDGVNILRTDAAFHANGTLHVGSTGHIYNRANTNSYIRFTNPNIEFATPSGQAIFSNEISVNDTITTPNNTSLRLEPSGSTGWIFLGSPTDGTKLYHYSRGDNGQNTVYDFDGGYYKINTTSTSGFNLQRDTLISGDLTVSGIVTAQEFHTEFVSASIVYQSGSTKFGDTLDDIHQFTGSTHIQSGSYKVDTYGEGIRWYDGTNYNTNRIQLSSAQNMQLQAGGVIQLQSSTQIVNGRDLTFNNSGNTTRFDINNAGGTDEYRLDFSSGSTQLMVISGSGNVGIGTTAPAVPLHVSGTFRHEGSQYNIQLIGGSEIRGSNALTLRGLNSYAAISAAGSIFYTAGTDHIFRDTNSNALVTIKQAGNVGIGTTTPTSKLHISGTNDVVSIEGSGSTILDIQGSQGQLFSVVDSLSGSLMSVNDISGLPILEVFSDDTVVMGEYGTNALVVTGSQVGIGTAAPATDKTLTVQMASDAGGIRVWRANRAQGLDIGYASITSLNQGLSLVSPEGFTLTSGGTSFTSGNLLSVKHTNTARQLRSSNSQQAGISLQPNIGQSGTANYVGLEIDVNTFTTGSGQSYLANFSVDGSSMFHVTDQGSGRFAGDLTVEGSFTELSAQRFKENITPLTGSLDKVIELEGVTYNKIGEEKQEIGLIAEQVASIYPEFVEYDENGQTIGIQYSRLTSVLIESMKELDAKVKAQELFIKDIVSRIEKLESK